MGPYFGGNRCKVCPSGQSRSSIYSLCSDSYRQARRDLPQRPEPVAHLAIASNAWNGGGGYPPCPRGCQQGSAFCSACYQQWYLKRVYLNKYRVESSYPQARVGKSGDNKHVSSLDSPTVGAASQVVPSVRSGSFACRESVRHIPVKVDGVPGSAVLDIAHC